ncbi:MULTISPECIES: hypothetical protein [Streptomyces]|uniref:hypothetical protein n=1 Tax=Streptomyces TaxID=1883 RepID=UPI001E414E6D|nr:hypothetical protein [Streptomyces sp. CMSTAAHL-2]MCE3033137.1 hypothetical protein [Streptomyces sp. CMSTAAHL-2]
MSLANAEFSLGAEDALLLFRDLEEYVVSLDRILSRLAAGADPAFLADYPVDRRVAARPARARGTVGDALEAVIGAEALEDIAEGVFRYSGP